MSWTEKEAEGEPNGLKLRDATQGRHNEGREIQEEGWIDVNA